MKAHRLFLVSFLIVAMSMLTGWRSHHHRHHHKKHSVETLIEETVAPKTLDLSLPLQVKNEASTTHAKSDFPIEKLKKIQREVELNPQAIMSIEPEQDKIKSFDGAGFAINIKR
jgi:hypothetical protein